MDIKPLVDLSRGARGTRPLLQTEFCYFEIQFSRKVTTPDIGALRVGAPPCIRTGHAARSANGPGNGSAGSRISRRGAWTPEAVTFRKCCMSKRKNLNAELFPTIVLDTTLDLKMNRLV